MKPEEWPFDLGSYKLSVTLKQFKRSGSSGESPNGVSSREKEKLEIASINPFLRSFAIKKNRKMKWLWERVVELGEVFTFKYFKKG